jgi:ATP-dependent exoDNAse (exonuclease V) alpha subunit
MLDKVNTIPLIPAFAMTAHKAQGKMDVMIMDLESTSGTESPYVMMS